MVGLLAQKMIEAGVPEKGTPTTNESEAVEKKEKKKKSKKKHKKNKLKIPPKTYKLLPSTYKKSPELVKDSYPRRKIRRAQSLNNTHFRAWQVYRKEAIGFVVNPSQTTIDNLFRDFLKLQDKKASRLAALYREDVHSFEPPPKVIHEKDNGHAKAISDKLIELNATLFDERIIKGLHLCTKEQVIEIAQLGLTLLSQDLTSAQKTKIEKFLNRFKKQLRARGKSFWLEVGNQEWFKWPDTDLIEEISQSSLDGVDWDIEGPLSVIGYRVGLYSELSEAKRQQILSYAFESNIERLNPSLEQEWGIPCSTKRLQKIAVSIATFAKNAKRKSGNYQQAISDWESDLDFLYEKYYIGFFDFSWPRKS